MKSHYLLYYLQIEDPALFVHHLDLRPELLNGFLLRALRDLRKLPKQLLDRSTYAVNSIDEGIVTTVAHGQPMAAEEDDVDVSIAEKRFNFRQCEVHSIRIFVDISAGRYWGML